jgi:hypothetical protein
MPIILATWEAEIKRITVESQAGEIAYETLSQKIPIENRTGRGSQVVECLHNKFEAWSSNSSTDKKENETF